MPQVRIIAKNFMDMVAALPAVKLDRLYENPFICEAILRSLPPLAKKYVLQMLCIAVPVTANSMEEWVLPDGASKHRVAIDRLIQLRIFTETLDRKRVTNYTLNPIFQTNLKKRLVDDVVLPREPMPSNITVRLPSLEDLEAFALEQWEFCNLGEAYNTSSLSEAQKNTIKDLADLGLVKLQQGRKDSWFIPTRLATNLSVSMTDSPSRKQGFVVVETNFRLYAYSTSKLHCEILRLFSRVEYQLPNLIVGAITKESLYGAFENGITAGQIISFLQQNAHPRVSERVPSIPENVTDQIRLWETDLNRVEMTLAYHYDEFPSRDLFEGASDFARGYNALLWESPDDSKKMRLVVKAENHVHMREYLGRQKQ